MPRSADSSHRELYQRYGFSRWLGQFVEDRTFTARAIAKGKQQRRGSRDAVATDIEAYLSGKQKAILGTAFDLGEIIGSRVPYVCGITALYTGDFIGHAIAAAEIFIPDWDDAGLFLAAIPLANYGGALDIGDTGLTREMRDRQALTRRVLIARELSEAILRKHRPWTKDAWRSWTACYETLHRPTSDLYLPIRAALALEGCGVVSGDEIAELCLPPIFRSFRKDKAQRSRQELLHDARVQYGTSRVPSPRLERIKFPELLQA